MANLGEVGEAHVELRAEMRRLRRDLRTAQTTSRRAGTRAGQAFGQGFATRLKGSVGPAIAGALSVAAVRQFTRATEEAVNKLDSIAKTADKLGVTTDQLQELRGAAELSGVAINQFDMGFQRFTRRAAEAAEGTGEAKDALKQMGIELRDANGQIRPMVEVLKDVADRFQAIEDPATRLRLAFKLFDSEGVIMVNMFKNGSAGLEQLMRRFREAGGVIEEDMIRSSERLRDELTLLQKGLDADVTQALVRLGPVIIQTGKLLVWLANLIATAHEGWRRLFAGEMFRSGQSILVGELTNARSELEMINQQIDNLTSGKPATDRPFRGPGDAAANIEGRVDPQEDPDAAFRLLDTLQSKAETTKERIRELESELTKLGGGATDLVPSADVTAPSLPGAGTGSGGSDPIDKRTEALKRLQEELRRTIQEERNQRQEIQAETSVLGENEMAREMVLNQLRIEQLENELLQRLKEQGIELTEDETAALRKQLAVLRQVSAARIADEANLRSQQEALQDAERAEQEWISAIQQTGQEITALIDQGASFVDILQAIIMKLMQMQSVQDALFGVNTQGTGSGGGGLFGDLFSSLFGGGLSGGVTTTANNPFQGASSSLFTSSGAVALPSFQHGGVPPLGQFSMVGERGAELAYFDTPARIFSNNELRDLMSGETAQQGAGGLVINQNLSFLDARGAKEASGSIARKTAEAARRGGGYT